MATIKSNYLNQDFEFEPIQMQGDDGNVLTIIPHNILFDIIQNRLSGGKSVSYAYTCHQLSREHSFIECTMSDENGRKVTEFGESVPDTLKSDISKTIPGTMAAIRAFDRAAIRYLNFACEGKIYSDNEIPLETLKPSAKAKKEPDRQQTAVKANASEKKKEKSPEAKPSTAAAAAKSFSMTVPAESKLQKEVLNALDSHDEIIVFDTETTGLKPDKDRIIEIAAQKFSIDHTTQTLKVADEFQMYINPEMQLSQDIVELTGISNEFLEDKLSETEAFIDIYNFFGDNPQILGGYNTGFDVRFLSDLYKRHGKTLKADCQLDVCRMAKELLTGVENHKLSTIANLFGMEGDDFHTASADTDYTARLLNIFVAEYRKGAAAAASPAAAAPSSEKPQEGKDPAAGGKLRPEIKSMTLFAPSQTVRRIYVNTTAQTIYFDLVKRQWFSKDGDLNDVDMEYLEKEAWKIADAKSQSDFEAFKGKWVAEGETAAA